MKALAALLATALLAGCASLATPSMPASASAETAACARWFEQLDAAIDQAGVRDAEAERIAGFAGLRVDRFTASLRGRAGADAAAFEAWLARLQELEFDGGAVRIGFEGAGPQEAGERARAQAPVKPDRFGSGGGILGG